MKQVFHAKPESVFAGSPPWPGRIVDWHPDTKEVTVHFPSIGSVDRIQQSEISKLTEDNLVKYSKSIPREVRGKYSGRSLMNAFNQILRLIT